MNEAPAPYSPSTPFASSDVEKRSKPAPDQRVSTSLDTNGGGSDLPLQPTLSDDTVDLRPTVPADWDALFAVASDPEIWAVHPAGDRWQEPVFRRYFADALASCGGLTIRERKSGRVIGASRYRPDPDQPGACEIGWTFLARDHWGGVTNRAVKRLMIGHILRHFDAATFMVGENNVRSRRAMEKIGGRLTDRREVRTLAGVDHVHVIYEIDRPLA